MKNMKPYQLIQEKCFWDPQSIYEIETRANFNSNLRQIGFLESIQIMGLSKP